MFNGRLSDGLCIFKAMACFQGELQRDGAGRYHGKMPPRTLWAILSIPGKAMRSFQAQRNWPVASYTVH
jgi:hypothetical protein